MQTLNDDFTHMKSLKNKSLIFETNFGKELFNNDWIKFTNIVLFDVKCY
jgi:hypothetical protein